MVLPIASVCSTRLPVSVLVRAPRVSLGVFLGSMDLAALPKWLRLASQAYVLADLPARTPYTLSRGRPDPRPPILLRRLIG